MPSSLTLPAAANPTRHQQLLTVLENNVPDPRKARGIRYPLASVLAMAVAATIAGARSFAAIGQWCAASTPAQLAAFGLGHAAPDESTLRKLFARIDTDALDTALGVWMWTRTFVVGQRRIIALDGKTVRGARDRTADTAAPHLVAAFDHEAGVVLGQVCVDAKSNEIPAARTLLAQLDLAGAVATLDAMHTQTATVEQITAAGGDYVFTVKKNMPSLHAKHKALPWKSVPAARSTTTAKGKRITRTIKVTSVPDWIEFPGAKQVAQLRRTVTGKGRKKTVEVVYLITSADHVTAPPEVLAAWVQGHWGIENKLHYVRDVTFGEDLSQVRTGQTPRVMAACRNIAISLLRIAGWDNIAAALRHHARQPDQAVALALT